MTGIEDDDGMTLVELIVAITVGAAMLALIAVTFVNGVSAQRDGLARDAATGASNVVATSLSVSIRNASDIRVSDAGKRLDAVYVAPDGGLECRAWELVTSSATSSLAYRASKTGALPAADSTWGVLASGVKGTPDEAVIFTDLGDRSVQLSMEITTDGVAIAVSDGITAQATADAASVATAVTEGRLPCWP